MLDDNDRLYELMPVIYRLRDTERGDPLKALLRVVGEQVTVISDDIHQLYDNWFIETSEDWVVPYLGDLVGYRQIHQAGEPGDARTAEGAAYNKILIPRSEIANTVRYRRRKGTLLVLQELANVVAGWSARPVEFYRLLGWTQHLDHQHAQRGRTVDVRAGAALDLIGGPFEREAHTVDVRRVNSLRTRGRFNNPSIALFVWRLNVYSVTSTPATCLEQVGPWCYTFSVLGQDSPVFNKPAARTQASHVVGQLEVPDAISRHRFHHHLADYYGSSRSVAIWADWASRTIAEAIPASAIVAADLSDWTYRPARDFVAVDPERGRIAFPPGQPPRRVRVRYHYAFSADLGGGEYRRQVQQPRQVRIFRVGEDETLKRINDALNQWATERRQASTDEQRQAVAHAVIELTDSNVYVEPLSIQLESNTSLQLRAANGKRPVIRLLDWQTDAPDSLTILMRPGTRVTLDGLLITGRGIRVSSMAADDATGRHDAICSSQLHVRHCTLVPGWSLGNDCSAQRPSEPSLELFNLRAQVRIEHSILGPIDINEDETRFEAIPIEITDSVLDSKGPKKEAIGAPGAYPAHARLTMRRCTVFGIVDVFAVDLAENSIFDDCVNVKRRQIGCMRFCYVQPGCRTPRRYHCQPDLAEQMVRHGLEDTGVTDPVSVARAQQQVRQRVRPQFNSQQYGTPTYCQLSETCPDEINRGADDKSEMGVFHDLFQPQRMANLSARLDEFTPADMQAGIILVN